MCGIQLGIFTPKSEREFFRSCSQLLNEPVTKKNRPGKIVLCGDKSCVVSNVCNIFSSSLVKEKKRESLTKRTV